MVHIWLFIISCVQTLFHYLHQNTFVTCIFSAFYRLIDKISSFLLFMFPPFSHFFVVSNPFKVFLISYLSPSLSLPLLLSLFLNQCHYIFTQVYVLSYFKPLVFLSTCLFKNLEWPTVQQYVLSFYHNGYYQSKYT